MDTEFEFAAHQSRLMRAIEQELSEKDELLWDLLFLLQGEVFYTAKGLSYTYTIKGGEIFVSRKDKSITRSSVLIAFNKALELGMIVSGPKKLGTFGASYLYPIFMRIGIIKSRK